MEYLSADMLKCRICEELPKDPVEVTCCSALFCWECLMHSPVGKCIVCGSEGAIESCRTDPLVQKLIDSLHLPCPNERCSLRFRSRSLLNAHILDCPMELIDCKFAQFGCSEKVAKMDYESHLTNSMPHHLELLVDEVMVLKASRVAERSERGTGEEANAAGQEVDAPDQLRPRRHHHSHHHRRDRGCMVFGLFAGFFACLRSLFFGSRRSCRRQHWLHSEVQPENAQQQQQQQQNQNVQQQLPQQQEDRLHQYHHKRFCKVLPRFIKLVLFLYAVVYAIVVLYCLLLVAGSVFSGPHSIFHFAHHPPPQHSISHWISNWIHRRF